MFNILIVKNRYTKKTPNLSKGLDWFKDNTPLKVTVEEISTDFDLSWKKVGNDTYNGVVADGIKEKLRPLIPEGKYHAVVLIYGNKSEGIGVSICETEPLYFSTDFIQLEKLTDKGKTLNHEMFHAFFERLRRRGINIEDPMDKVFWKGEWREYYRNNDLDAEESNRTIAMSRLAPYWQEIMKLDKLNTPLQQPTPSPVTTNFDKAFAHLMKWEGAYVNDPRDPGGETKYGISKRSYPNLNIAMLKESEAKAIYLRDFWTPLKCDGMPYAVALNVFDMGVNMGSTTGAKVFQEALGVAKDGKIGPMTLKAANSANVTDLVEKIACLRLLRYTADKNFGIYKNGWFARTLDTVTSSLK